MKFNNSPIGIFDSGLGGLTVYKEIRKLLPHEDLIYFGDTARVPYGNKSKETIIRYSSEIFRFLAGKGVKIVIVACNTSSSLALGDLRKIGKIPVFGVIEPGAKKAALSSMGGNIAVIGTSATIKSRAYSHAIYKEAETSASRRREAGFKVIEKACPLFVPLVEEGFLNKEITANVIRYYLEPVIAENPSCLVLGCTHYPILEDFITDVIGGEIKIIDSCIKKAKAGKHYMETKFLLKSGSGSGRDSFFFRDDFEKF